MSKLTIPDNQSTVAYHHVNQKTVHAAATEVKCFMTDDVRFSTENKSYACKHGCPFLSRTYFRAGADPREWGRCLLVKKLKLAWCVHFNIYGVHSTVQDTLCLKTQQNRLKNSVNVLML